MDARLKEINTTAVAQIVAGWIKNVPGLKDDLINAWLDEDEDTLTETFFSSVLDEVCTDDVREMLSGLLEYCVSLEVVMLELTK